MKNKAWAEESPQIPLALLEDFVFLKHQIYKLEDAIPLCWQTEEIGLR